MPVNEADAQWLRSNGYRNLCYISWARDSGEQIRKTASACAEDLKKNLKPGALPEAVFFDERMVPGTQWEKEFAPEVCSSLCLVAFCSNHLYQSKWCLSEVATMNEHGKRRLGDRHRLIIPVPCWGSPMPPELGRFQSVEDISARLLRPDPRFRDKKWYQDLVSALGLAISENAQALATARKAADCVAPLWISRDPSTEAKKQFLPFLPL